MPPKGSQASHNKVHDTGFICEEQRRMWKARGNDDTWRIKP